MRILAIRGENLASLRRFAIDLDDPDVLGGVGLFAITGPTGAGKSTLLDALCLALYDKTPRFSGSRTDHHRVGRDPADPNNLSSSDVRNILRRGAGAGYAEVDFVGRDAGHYRARWSVHRARNRPGARMQSQTVQLTDLLDGQPLSGSTKRETLARIEELAGLSFDQFRRSVLLAQGDFDAFLRAPVKERGTLLERMTGTEIYRRLSVAAHERHRDARASLQRLDDQLAAHPVLAPAARQRLDTQLTTVDAWTAAALGRRTASEATRRWHIEAERLGGALTAARAAAQAAQAAFDAAEPRRERLAAARRALPLQPLVAAVERAAERAEQRRATLAEATAALATAAHTARATAEDARRSGVELAAARDAIGEARSDLDAARALDARCAAAQETVEKRASTAAAAREDLARAERAIAIRRDALDQVQRGLADARSTSAAGERLRPLLADWAEVRAHVEAWLAQREAAEAFGATRAEIEGQLADATRAHQAARATLADRSAQLTASRETLADGDAAGLARAAARAHRTHHRQAEHARVLKDLRERSRQAVRLADALGAADEALSAATQRRTPLRRTRTRLERQLEALHRQLTTARQALELSRAAENLAGHRARLTPGEPCPICGALEHPGIDPALIATDRFDAEVGRLGAEIDAASARLDATREALSAIAAELEIETRSRDRLIDDARRLADDWAMSRLGIGSAIPTDPAAPDAPGQLNRLLTAARAERDTAHDAARALDTQLEARRGLEATVETQRAAEAGARRAVEGAWTQLEAMRRRLAEVQAQQASAEAEATRAAGRLDHVWSVVSRDEVRAAPERILDGLDARLAALRAADATVAAAEAEIAAATNAHSDARAALDAATRLATERDAAEDEARRAAADLRAARDDLFDGRATAEVAAALDERLERARRAAEAARQAAEDTARAATRAEERQTSARTALADADTDRADAERRLSTECAAAGVERTDLAALADLSGATLADEAAALMALATARDAAEAVFDERAADHAAHLSDAPAVDALTAEKRWQRANSQYDAVLRAGAEALARRDRDDAARAAREHLEDERREAESARLIWGQLDQLIGAADGGAFREFAQSLTLDAVVVRANHHLDTLARRYRLMRVPGENLALQIVDRHMGDEVRTVKSLSGGETFLVSLALALGLATLSAQDTRIESLFIDEGFGTLDADTLDVVLGALDALQAEGRQIGLISHVPGLAQRIGARVCVEPTSSGMSGVTIRRPGWSV